jgi:hypothetical protein
MIVGPDLNDPMLLQILPDLLCSRICFIRDQIVSSFRRAGHIDSEGDELGHGRDEPRFTCLLA